MLRPVREVLHCRVLCTVLDSAHALAVPHSALLLAARAMSCGREGSATASKAAGRPSVLRECNAWMAERSRPGVDCFRQGVPEWTPRVESARVLLLPSSQQVSRAGLPEKYILEVFFKRSQPTETTRWGYETSLFKSPPLNPLHHEI